MLLNVLDAESSAEWVQVEIAGSYKDDFDESRVGEKGLVPRNYLEML